VEQGRVHRRATGLTVGGLLVLGGLLRAWGLPQGYPEFYGHVDEIGVAASIWNFFRSATLEPTEFTYPALFSYLTAAGIWLSAWLGLVGLPEKGGLIERIVFLSYVDPGWSAVVGRVVSLVASTLAVPLLYAVGRRCEGRGLGLSLAAAAALAVVPVRHAHQALPDSLTLLWGAGALWAAVCVWREGDWRGYLVGGLCAGLMLATKYNGALSALAIVAAHAVRVGPRQMLLGPRLWVAGAVAVMACLAASPYLLLAFDQYRAVAQYQVSSLGFSLRETTPWWWIPRALAGEEWLLGGAMLSGVALALVRRQAIDTICLAAVLPAFAYIGSWTRESPHYLLPYYPFLLLLAGRAATALAERLRCRARWVPVVFVAVALLPNLVRSIDLGRDLSRPDTRELASTWIEEHVPSGATIGMTWLPYCPRLDLLETRAGILQHLSSRPEWQQELRSRWAKRPAYRVVNLEAWRSQPLVPEALRDQVDLDDPETRRIFSRGWRSRSRLRAAGVDLLVVPAAVTDRYLLDDTPPDELAARFRWELTRAYFGDLLDPAYAQRLVSLPHTGERARGGRIDIYRLRGGGGEP
jgi:hypothetical protein